MNCFASIIRILVCLTTFVGSVHAASVEGVVVTEGGVIPKSTVHLYRNLQDLLDRGVPVATATSGNNGVYEMAVPPGEYFAVAEGLDGKNRVMAYHGANPIRVGSAPLWLPMIATSPAVVTRQHNGETSITGQILYKGAPVADAHVSLYSSGDRNIRGLGLATFSSDSDGRFRFDVQPGRYVVAARKRVAGGGRMPLRKNDLFCFNLAGSLELNEGSALSIEISCYSKDHPEEILAPGVSLKRERADRVVYRTVAAPRSRTAVTGTVSDLSGVPKEGLTVTAYRREPGVPFQMHHVRQASAHMAVTDSQGRFTLQLEGKSSYYLVARQYGGDSPWKGELYGLYEASADHAITVGDRPVTANITVGRIMTEKSTVQSESAVAGAAGKVTIAPAIISNDTTWSGEVHIEQPVLVARGATLRIQPGTLIRFKRIDSDGDGIGDGEIRVTGRLVAKGTADRPIRFESAEKEPAAGDWSYLLLFTSGHENVIENCLVSHAFTGVQAHFSKAVIRDSIFTHNREGIRFGRAELRIEHNLISSNDIGIRYHRLEGPVEIVANVIQGNGVGMFLVPSSQQRVDSRTEAYIPDLRYFNMPVVRENVISGNSRYNFELGERLATNVPVGGNWWGDVSVAGIRKTVYDRERDNDLGSLMIEPVLPAPMPAAGPRWEKRL